MKKWLVGLLVACVLLAGIGPVVAASDLKVLRWACGGTEQSEELELPRWQPIADYLEPILGMEVKLMLAGGHVATLLAMQHGHVEMMQLSAFGLVLGTDVLGMELEALVRPIKKKTGTDGYHSLIITRSDSGIKTLEDLKGRTFAFVNPGSTSGYLVPKTEILKAGIDPDAAFGTIMYAGGHQPSIMAVYSGQVDAGATNDNRLQDAIDSGTVKDILIIHTSATIYNPPIVVQVSMDSELKEAIRKAFLEMPEELALRTAQYNLGWVPAKMEDYQFARDMASYLGLDLERMAG